MELDIEIHHVLLSVNGGPGRARNEGVKYAKNADAFFFCDADDRFYTHHIRMGLGMLQRHPGKWLC